MRTIKTFDSADYDTTWPTCKRDSARAIIFIGDSLLMINSTQYSEYKFPGGGIEPGESHRDALIREVKEETGYTILPDSIAEYGKTLIRRKSHNTNEIFEQESFYYSCEVDTSKTSTPTLDHGYEQEYGYSPALVPPHAAIVVNERLFNLPAIPWVQRDTTVLRELQVTLQFKSQLSQAFPTLYIDTITPLANGKAGCVYVVNNDLVFKISLANESANSWLSLEYEILQALHEKMDFPIPQALYFTKLPDGRNALGETRIPGVQFSQELYETLTPCEKDNIFTQLGGIANQLHIADVPHFANISVYDPAANLADFKKYYTQDVKSTLTPQEQARVEQIVNDFKKAAAQYIPLVLCHGDLHFWNLNYDPQTKKLCGLLDFGLISYNDPLNDFNYFWSDTVSIMLRAYNGDIGPNAAARHLFYCMCNIIEEAHDELQTGSPGYFVDALKRVIFQEPLQTIQNTV